MTSFPALNTPASASTIFVSIFSEEYKRLSKLTQPSKTEVCSHCDSISHVSGADHHALPSKPVKYAIEEL